MAATMMTAFVVHCQMLGKDCVRDAILGARAMLRAPAAAAAVVCTLALAIGANTSIFSLVHSIVLRRLPVAAPEQLAILSRPKAFTMPAYQEFCARQTAFSGVLGREDFSADFDGGAVRGRVMGEFVTREYYHVLGVRAALGRLLDAGDETAPAEPGAIVISYRLWAEYFAADSGVLGRTIRVNGRPFRIVGVTERAFAGSLVGQLVDFQISFSSNKALGIPIWVQVLGRRPQGISLNQAQAMTLVIGTELQKSFPRLNEKFVLEDGSRGFSDLRSRLRTASLMLLIGVGLLLLITCANIAGLLSARAMGRQFEMAVRLSLGATRGRLVRQLLVESLVLGLVGGWMGYVLAHWGANALRNILQSNGVGAALDIKLDMTVFVVTMGVSVCAALLCGLLPAWQASATDPVVGLRAGGFFFARSRSPLVRRLLVVGQVALSLVLLSGAAVLVRTLRNLETVDLGFRLDEVVIAKLQLSSYGYSSEAAQRLFRRLEDDVRRMPDVKSAALSSVGVLSGDMSMGVVRFPGIRSHDAQFHYVSDEYFRTLGTPVLHGREFDHSESDGSRLTAIVNERFAKQVWFGDNPVGRQIQVEGVREIVGVVKDSNYRMVREDPPATVYLPLSQVGLDVFPSMTLFVRMRGSASVGTRLLAQLIRQSDPALPTMDIQTLINQRDHSIATERTLTFAAVAFALFATVIAVVGLAGVIAYSVSSRTREIGIRMVCGAGRLEVASVFLKETMLLVACGILLGLPLAWGALKTLSAFVFKAPAQDPYAMAGAAALFGAVGLIAVGFPLVMAVRLDPGKVLRE
jgi:predicted permease